MWWYVWGKYIRLALDDTLRLASRMTEALLLEKVER